MHVAQLHLVVSRPASPGSLRWPQGLRACPLHLQAGTDLQISSRHPPAMLFSLLLPIILHRGGRKPRALCGNAFTPSCR